MGSPNIGSRAWVWRQYDQIVRGGTVVRPGSDAAVVRVPCERDGETIEKFLAFAVDCNGRDVRARSVHRRRERDRRGLPQPRLHGRGAHRHHRLPQLRQPGAAGGRWSSFARAIDGIAAACKALDVPIVSGNVSLYNETVVQRGGATTSLAILPTPTVAAVGLVRSRGRRRDDALQARGRRGDPARRPRSPGARARSAASEWLVRTLGKLAGEAPLIDLDAEVKLQKLVLGLARSQRLASAHDVSDGGLAVALAECCAVPDAGDGVIGARIELAGRPARARSTRSARSSARALRASSSASPARARPTCSRGPRAAGVPAVRIGTTGGDALSIAAPPLGSLSVGVRELRARADACLTPIVGRLRRARTPRAPRLRPALALARRCGTVG